VLAGRTRLDSQMRCWNLEASSNGDGSTSTCDRICISKDDTIVLASFCCISNAESLTSWVRCCPCLLTSQVCQKLTNLPSHLFEFGVSIGRRAASEATSHLDEVSPSSSVMRVLDTVEDRFSKCIIPSYIFAETAHSLVSK